MVIVADRRQPQALQLHYEEDPRCVKCLSFASVSVAGGPVTWVVTRGPTFSLMLCGHHFEILRNLYALFAQDSTNYTAGPALTSQEVWLQHPLLIGKSSGQQCKIHFISFSLARHLSFSG